MNNNDEDNFFAIVANFNGILYSQNDLHERIHHRTPSGRTLGNKGCRPIQKRKDH
jgi:hypothetical protein